MRGDNRKGVHNAIILVTQPESLMLKNAFYPFFCRNPDVRTHLTK
jgi:hypothetical protein